MYQEIRNVDIKRIHSFGRSLERSKNWQELIDCSLYHLGRIVSNDCLCWNEWSNGFGEPLRIQTVDEYEEALLAHIPGLEANIGNHPILSNVGWEPLRDSPLRISDFESDRDFFQNPIFRDFYRHVDSHRQMAYVYGKGSNNELFITMNRRLSDFTDRETQCLKLSGDVIAPFANLLRATEARTKWFDQISTDIFQPAGISPLGKLTQAELKLLAQLFSGLPKGENTRSDTRRRTLQSLREKLDITTTRELVAVLTELKPKPKGASDERARYRTRT